MADQSANAGASAPCPHMDTCPLFPLFRQGSNLEVWKSIYCHAGFSDCERYKLSQSGKEVPLALLPNGDQLPGV